MGVQTTDVPLMRLLDDHTKESGKAYRLRMLTMSTIRQVQPSVDRAFGKTTAYETGNRAAIG
jgi:hypothetical protein